MTQMSKEYAVSLYTIAAEEDSEKTYLEEIRFANEVISCDTEFAELLTTPALTKEERVGVIDKVFDGRLSEYVMSFLKVLCEAGYMKLLPECVSEYEVLYREANLISHAKVTSAADLTEDEKQRIAEKTEALLGKKCEIEFIVDEKLMGGAVIEADGKVFDGSLRRKLREMKEVIKK